MSQNFILIFILLFSLFSQWSRWLPVYLSSSTLTECNDLCVSLAFTPLCETCDTTDDACTSCHNCRTEYDSEYYNLEDGICMSTREYGIMTGFGFSFTFSALGILAGFIVDMKADRGACILGVSAILCGLATLLSAYCTTFLQMILTRAFLGGFQAFGAPASVHLITSAFNRPSDRPIANAAYTVGVYVGAGLASLSAIFTEYIGWRNVCTVVGLLSLFCAIIFEIFVDWNMQCLSFRLFTSGRVSTSNNNDHDGTREQHEHRESQPLIAHASDNYDSNRDNNNHSPHSSCQGMTPSKDKDTCQSEEATYVSLSSSSYQCAGVDSTEEGNDVDSAIFDNHGQKKRINEGCVRRNDDSNEENNETEAWERQSCEDKEYNYDNSNTNHNKKNNNQKLVNDNNSMRCNHNTNHRHLLHCCGGSQSFGGQLTAICWGGANPWAMCLLILASSLRFMASIAVFVYFPILVSRKFPSKENIFSTFNAFVVLSCGSFSAFAGGKLGQLAVRARGTIGLANLAAITCLLAVLPFACAFATSDFWVSMIMLAVAYFVGEAWMGASMALLQSLAPKNAQGLSMSVYLFVNWNASALMIDIIGWLDPGTEQLSSLLLASVSGTLCLSCLAFVVLGFVMS